MMEASVTYISIAYSVGASSATTPLQERPRILATETLIKPQPQKKHLQPQKIGPTPKNILFFPSQAQPEKIAPQLEKIGSSRI